MNQNAPPQPPILREQEHLSPPELGDSGGECVSPNLQWFAFASITPYTLHPTPRLMRLWFIDLTTAVNWYHVITEAEKRSIKAGKTGHGSRSCKFSGLFQVNGALRAADSHSNRLARVMAT